MEGADAVYPASASALARGRRLRRAEPRARPRRKTVPVTFAEIKEVDEDNSDLGAGSLEQSGGPAAARRRPDVLAARPGAAAARRRAPALRELSPARAGSEPAAPPPPPPPPTPDT